MLFFMSSFPALTTQHFVGVSAGGSDVVRLKVEKQFQTNMFSVFLRMVSIVSKDLIVIGS